MTKQRIISLFAGLLLVPAGLAAQPIVDIWQIQGSGGVSPYAGQRVRTHDNIVTARSFDGFFMQTPGPRSDGDPLTSDGLFVFLGQPPSVQPGDRVSLTGLIREREGLTEFADGAEVVVLGGGANLPLPVELDEQFPAPAPETIPQLERVEGMRVAFLGYAAGPSNRFGECPVTIRRERPFRGAGIAWPGRPGLPVWDGNPEIFWLDTYPDDLTIAAGSAIQATGVLTFAFNRYQVLSESYGVDPSTIRTDYPVRARRPSEYTVASLNVLRLVPQNPDYAIKLAKLADFIVHFMGAPDIIALQEVGAARALDDLAERIRRIDSRLDYRPHFRSGNDDIHLGFLTSARVQVDRLEQLAAAERLSTGGALHDRPPLLLTSRLSQEGPQLRVLNVHIRSRIGIEEADSLFVRRKRYEQSLSIARLAQARRDSNLIVTGDFNSFSFTDGYVDVLNQVAGLPSLGALLAPQSIVSPPLTDLSRGLPDYQRYSYVRRGNAELIDHCLAGELSGIRIQELQLARGNADAPEILADDATTPLRCSDHDGLVLFLEPEQTVARAPEISDTGLRIHGPNPLGPGDELWIEAPGNRPVWIALSTLDGKPILRKSAYGPRILWSIPPFLPAAVYLLTAEQGKRRVMKRLFLY